MEIKFSKQNLMTLLEYKSLKSVYRILKMSLIPVKQKHYSLNDYQKLKISKTLLNQGKTAKYIQNYWTDQERLKNVTEI